MIYLQRGIVIDRLVGTETTIRFHFTDLAELTGWWIVVKHGAVELCHIDPGKEVDVCCTAHLRTMIGWWTGDTSWRTAPGDGRSRLVGPPGLSRSVCLWLAPGRSTAAPDAQEPTG